MEQIFYIGFNLVTQNGVVPTFLLVFVLAVQLTQRS